MIFFSHSSRIRILQLTFALVCSYSEGLLRTEKHHLVPFCLLARGRRGGGLSKKVLLGEALFLMPTPFSFKPLMTEKTPFRIPSIDKRYHLSHTWFLEHFIPFNCYKHTLLNLCCFLSRKMHLFMLAILGPTV